MTKYRPAIFALLTLVALASIGCKRSARAPKTPAAPTPTPTPTPAAVVPQQRPVSPPHQPKLGPVQGPAPPPPAQPSATPPSPTPTPPPPAFGQILTSQQQAEFRRSYQQSAQSARQALSQVSGRPLTRDQADTANRIRSFLSQADEAQPRDPAAAAQLARRAELLARDLLSSLK